MLAFLGFLTIVALLWGYVQFVPAETRREWQAAAVVFLLGLGVLGFFLEALKQGRLPIAW